MGDLRVCEQGYSRFTKDSLVFAGVSVKALVSTLRTLAAHGQHWSQPSDTDALDDTLRGRRCLTKLEFYRGPRSAISPGQE